MTQALCNLRFILHEVRNFIIILFCKKQNEVQSDKAATHLRNVRIVIIPDLSFSVAQGCNSRAGTQPLVAGLCFLQ